MSADPQGEISEIIDKFCIIYLSEGIKLNIVPITNEL